MENATKTGAADLVVRVWGMGANGKVFSQNAYARDLSHEGALISGVDSAPNVGDTIGVQYQDRKARCQVASAKDVGLPQKFQVDVRLLSGQDCPWKELVPTTAPRPKSPAAPNSKRRFERHRVPFPIEIRDERGGGAPMQTSASDSSGRGCYVESLVPLPLGTQLSVSFWLDLEKIVTPAIVRTSDPGVGMGIEFTGLSQTNQDRLQQKLEEVNTDAKKL